MLRVNEMFKSIQGESTFAGLPCAFVRLTGCNLRCTYCETAYSWSEGEDCAVDYIEESVWGFDVDLVEITGGEPLMQEETPELCRRFVECGKTVLVETNGTRDISVLPEKSIRIVDVKTPGSGCEDSFDLTNLESLRNTDQLKFVITGRSDFDWACGFIGQYELVGRCEIIFSPCAGAVESKTLAEWILDRALRVRLGIQLHKVIWGDERGK